MRYFKILDNSNEIIMIGKGDCLDGITISKEEYESISQIFAANKIKETPPNTDERLSALEAAMLDIILGGST